MAAPELDDELDPSVLPPEPEELIADDAQEGDRSLIDEVEDIRDAYENLKEKGQQLKDIQGKQAARAQPAEPAAPTSGATPHAATAGSEAVTAGEGTAVTATAGAKKAGLRGVERKALQTGGQRVATRAAQEGGKQAAKVTAERAAVGGAARLGATLTAEVLVPVAGWIMAAVTLAWVALKTKVGKRALLIIGLIFLLPAMAFSLLFLNHGPTKTPATAEQKFAATKALALAGDPAASAEVVKKNAASMIARLGSVKQAAAKKYKNDAAKASAAGKLVDETIQLLQKMPAAAASKTERAKLADQVNVKLSQLSSQYPELIFTAGACADLKSFLDSRQLQVGSGPNGGLVVKGIMRNKNNEDWPASPDLCGSLVYALRSGFRIYTGTLSYGHAKHAYEKPSGPISQHWCGAAIDIGIINGEKTTNKSAATKKFMAELLEAHKRKEIFIWDLFGPYPEYEIDNGRPGPVNDGSHTTHIHLSGRTAIPGCHNGDKPPTAL